MNTLLWILVGIAVCCVLALAWMAIESHYDVDDADGEATEELEDRE